MGDCILRMLLALKTVLARAASERTGNGGTSRETPDPLFPLVMKSENDGSSLGEGKHDTLTRFPRCSMFSPLPSGSRAFPLGTRSPVGGTGSDPGCPAKARLLTCDPGVVGLRSPDDSYVRLLGCCFVGLMRRRVTDSAP